MTDQIDDKQTVTPPKTEDKPQEDQGTAPSPQDGKAKENQDTLPEKFKGKSAEDIAHSYIELERQLGKQSSDYGETKKQLEQWHAIGRIIAEDPELRKAVETKIDSLSGKEPEAKTPQPKHDDTREATEEMIITNFERDYGLNALPADKKNDLNQKIGKELADMLDPGGIKPVSEVLKSIPLNRLNKYLEKAYKLATIGDDKEQARSQAFLDARINSMASIGSIPSSGANTSDVELTPSEREIARKMGISEDKYKKQKIAILKGE